MGNLRMRKADSHLVAEYQNQRPSELIEMLSNNQGDFPLTAALFQKLKEVKGVGGRGSNLAEALMMHGDESFLHNVFKAVMAYAKAGCYAPANFEGMIRSRPIYRDRLILLMLRSCGQSKAVQSVIDSCTELETAA